MTCATRNLAVLLAAALAAGCGGAPATPGGNPAPPASGVDIKVGDTQVEVNKAEGTKVQVGGLDIQTGGAQGVKLPADFPKDVPIYDGAVIKVNLLAGAGEDATGMMHMLSSQPVEKVAEFYRAELKSQGWTEAQYVTSEHEGKIGVILGATKGNRQIAVTVSTDKKNQTVLNLTLGRK